MPDRDRTVKDVVKKERLRIATELRKRIQRYRDDPMSPVDGGDGSKERIGKFLQQIVPILENLAMQIEEGKL